MIIFYASGLAVPLALACLWALFNRRGAMRTAAAILFLLSGLLIYARFVEPRWLTVHEETILLPGASAASPSIRIALFADTHTGKFGHAMPYRRIVARINKANVNAVFLAGDIAYHAKPTQLTRELAALGGLNAPLYAVLGNHDVGFPGADVSREILEAFARHDIVNMHNRAVDVEIGGLPVTVSGASDLWQRQQDFGFTQTLSPGRPVLLLTHNPDTASVVPDDFKYDLMLAGHTHGGQVRVPGLVRRAIPTRWPFDKELHVYPSPSGDRLVYVTTGTGMVGLPLRFRMPPRIDVLTVHLPE